MKSVSVLAALSAIALPAPAGSAQVPDARPTLRATALCLQQADRDTDLVPTQIDRLCIATPSPRMPVDCYIAASRSLLLTDDQSIELCRCTATMEPITCFEATHNGSLLTETEILALCSPTITRGLGDDCRPFYR